MTGKKKNDREKEAVIKVKKQNIKIKKSMNVKEEKKNEEMIEKGIK
jgi:hypothetical protein